MKIEDEINELDDYLNSQYKEDTLLALDKLVRHLRDVQHDYELGFGEVSGLDVLGTLHKKGVITTQMLIAITPAVTNFNIPYEINLK